MSTLSSSAIYLNLEWIMFFWHFALSSAIESPLLPPHCSLICEESNKAKGRHSLVDEQCAAKIDQRDVCRWFKRKISEKKSLGKALCEMLPIFYALHTAWCLEKLQFSLRKLRTYGIYYDEKSKIRLMISPLLFKHLYLIKCNCHSIKKQIKVFFVNKK